MPKFNSPPHVLAALKRAEVRGRQQQASAVVQAGKLFHYAVILDDPARAKAVRDQCRTLAKKLGATLEETTTEPLPDHDAEMKERYLRSALTSVRIAFRQLFPSDAEVDEALDVMTLIVGSDSFLDEEGDYVRDDFDGPDEGEDIPW